MTSMYLLYFTVYTNLPHQPPINVLTVLMAYIKNIMICHEIPNNRKIPKIKEETPAGHSFYKLIYFIISKMMLHYSPLLK